MRAFTPLKKILTWTNMSIMVIALTANADSNVVSNAQLTAQSKNQEQHIKRQLDCLARNVWYEAGAESMKGQLAVAQVTVNRSRSKHWPNDLCAVVSQSTVKGNNKVCQFSWYCDPTKNKQKILSENHPAYIAARRVLLEGYRLPILGNNTYFFHAKQVHIQPTWPYVYITQIGNHIFYSRQKN